MGRDKKKLKERSAKVGWEEEKKQFMQERRWWLEEYE